MSSIELNYLESHSRERVLSALLMLWERSVRETHHFLSEEGIANIAPQVEAGLRAIAHLIVAEDNHRIVGFMGIEEDSIEMLFIDPDSFRQGIGRRLVNEAISHYDAQYVDVNEANGSAYAFYQSLGFEWFDRSERDDAGNPYPILHLKRS